MAQEIIQQLEIITPTDKAAEVIAQQEQILKLLNDTEQNLKSKVEFSHERLEKASAQMEDAKGKLIDIRKKLTEITNRVNELKLLHTPEPPQQPQSPQSPQSPAPTENVIQ